MSEILAASTPEAESHKPKVSGYLDSTCQDRAIVSALNVHDLSQLSSPST